MRKLWIGIIIIIVVVTVVLIVTKIKEKPEGTKIGAILPLSGSGAEYGNDQMNGMLIGVKEAKLKYDQNLNIIFDDSKGNATEGLNAFRKQLIENVPVVLTTLSSVSMAIAPIVEEKKVVMITVAAHPELTEGSHNIIRMLPTSTYYAEELAGYMATKMEYPKMGILYADDDFGTSLKESFSKSYVEKDGTILSSQNFQKGGTDFRSEVTKVLAKNPDALFVVGYSKDLGRVIRQARELGFKGKIYSTPEVSYPEVKEVAGDALEGCIFVYMWVDEESDIVHKFKEHYVSLYNSEPSLDSYLGFDEVMMVASALKTVEETGKNLRDALFEIKNFDGLTGTLTVSERGDVLFPLVLKTFSHGEIINLEVHEK